MKTIPLTRGKVAIIDDEDYEFLMQWKWYARMDLRTGAFYAERNSKSANSKRIKISMHRVISGVEDGKLFVDHIDRNTLNNCRYNLRIATRSQNLANRESHKKCTSKYLGVCRYPHNKWQASIRKDRIRINLGIFKNEIDAALAYNNAAKIHHGEFANLNSV